MLKRRCCVFDALIKKSHFICIFNATEVERREGKTALNVQRNKKSLSFFLFRLAASPGDGQDVFAISQNGVSWQETGLV